MKDKDREEAKRQRRLFSRIAGGMTIFAGLFAYGVGKEIGAGWGIAIFAVLALVPQAVYFGWFLLLGAGSFVNLGRVIELKDESIKILPKPGVATLRLKLDEHHGPDPRYEINAKMADPVRFPSHRRAERRTG